MIHSSIKYFLILLSDWTLWNLLVPCNYNTTRPYFVTASACVWVVEFKHIQLNKQGKVPDTPGLTEKIHPMRKQRGLRGERMSGEAKFISLIRVDLWYADRALTHNKWRWNGKSRTRKSSPRVCLNVFWTGRKQLSNNNMMFLFILTGFGHAGKLLTC